MSQHRQIDDNQDDLGRNVNNPKDRIGDRATVEKAQDVARKVELQRPYKHDKDDPQSNVSGGFNQKSRQDEH
jgi:hypothetical protein